MDDVTYFCRYFGACTNFALSASSQSENNQYLKIQVTRTPFHNLDFLKLIIGKDSAYLFFIYRQCLCLKPKDNAIILKTNY